MKKNNEFRRWLKRNETDLRQEYQDYAIRHDYDLDGPAPFDFWAARQFDTEQSYRRDEESRKLDQAEGSAND